MRVPSVLLLLASTARAAPAELALGELQLELEPRHDFINHDTSTDPYYRYAAFAQLSGGGSGGGDIAAGASGAVAGLNCDLVHATAQGRLRFDATYAGEATYSVCLLRAFITAEFSGRRGAGLEPALDARRSLWAQPYDATYDRMRIAGGEMWKDDEARRRHTLFDMALGHGTMHQGDRTVKTIDIDFALYRYRYLGERRVSVDAIVFTGESLKAGTDNKGGLAHAFLPLRVRYEDAESYVAAQAGWGLTGGKVTASGSTEVNGETVSSWSETIDSEGLPETSLFVGSLDAGWRRDRIESGARAARTIYPTFDGNIAREARLAGNVSYTAGQTRRTKLTLSPFVARTKTWTRDAGISRDITAGASLYFGRALTKQLRVDAIGQAGVSPYARLDRAGVGPSTLGGQVLVALSGRVTDLQR